MGEHGWAATVLHGSQSFARLQQNLDLLANIHQRGARRPIVATCETVLAVVLDWSYVIWSGKYIAFLVVTVLVPFCPAEDSKASRVCRPKTEIAALRRAS